MSSTAKSFRYLARIAATSWLIFTLGGDGGVIAADPAVVGILALIEEPDVASQLRLAVCHDILHFCARVLATLAHARLSWGDLSRGFSASSAF